MIIFVGEDSAIPVTNSGMKKFHKFQLAISIWTETLYEENVGSDFPDYDTVFFSEFISPLSETDDESQNEKVSILAR